MMEGDGGGSCVDTGGSGSWSQYLAGILRFLGPIGSDEVEAWGTLAVMVGFHKDKAWAGGIPALGLHEVEVGHEA